MGDDDNAGSVERRLTIKATKIPRKRQRSCAPLVSKDCSRSYLRSSVACPRCSSYSAFLRLRLELLVQLCKCYSDSFGNSLGLMVGCQALSVTTFCGLLTYSAMSEMAQPAPVFSGNILCT